MINSQIIKFAADTRNYGLKKRSKFIATSKNKICGDKITVELKIIKNIIKCMNYETESCVFCQASASLLSASIKHKNIKALSLSLNAAMEKRNFKELLKTKARINCIMLPFDSLKKAIYNTK
jgi:nitrogen fixation NifU-like protein